MNGIPSQLPYRTSDAARYAALQKAFAGDFSGGFGELYGDSAERAKRLIGGEQPALNAVTEVAQPDLVGAGQPDALQSQPAGIVAGADSKGGDKNSGRLAALLKLFF